MSALFALLIAGLIIPVVLMIIGVVNLFSPGSDVKKKGRNFLLSGVLIILIEFLIGYSICSGFRIH